MAGKQPKNGKSKRTLPTAVPEAGQNPPVREALVNEAELNLMLQQLSIAAMALNTVTTLIQGVGTRLQERK